MGVRSLPCLTRASHCTSPRMATPCIVTLLMHIATLLMRTKIPRTINCANLVYFMALDEVQKLPVSAEAVRIFTGMSMS